MQKQPRITAVATVVSSVSKIRNINLTSAEVSRAAEILQKRAQADWGAIEWDAAVTSLVESWRTNPIEQENKLKVVAANELCPLCQQPGQPITLMRGRKAYYCRSHTVVTPAIVN